MIWAIVLPAHPLELESNDLIQRMIAAGIETSWPMETDPNVQRDDNFIPMGYEPNPGSGSIATHVRRLPGRRHRVAVILRLRHEAKPTSVEIRLNRVVRVADGFSRPGRPLFGALGDAPDRRAPKS